MDWQLTCRVCLETGDMVSLFDWDENNEQLGDKYSFCCGIEVTKNDALPTLICLNCVDRLTFAYQFKQQCISSTETLKDCLEEFTKSQAQVSAPKKEINETETITIKQENGLLLQYELPVEHDPQAQWTRTLTKTPSTAVVTKAPGPRKRGRPRKYPNEQGQIDVSPYQRKKPKESEKEQESLTTLLASGSLDLKEEPLDEDDEEPFEADGYDATDDPDFNPAAEEPELDSEPEIKKELQPRKRGRPPKMRIDTMKEKSEDSEDVLLKETIMAFSEPIPDHILNPKPKKKRPNQQKKKYIYEKTHTCETCGASFTSNASLQAHIRRHLGIKPFVCSTASNHTMIDQTGKSVDPKDVPLSSRSDELTDLPQPIKSDAPTDLPLRSKNELRTDLPLPSRSDVLTDLPLPIKSELLTDLPLPIKSDVLKDLPLPIKTEIFTDLPLHSKSDVLTDSPLSSKSDVLTNMPLPIKSELLTDLSLPSRNDVLMNMPLPIKSELLTDLSLPSRSDVLTNMPLPIKSELLKDLSLPSMSDPLTNMPLPIKSELLKDLSLPLKSDVLTSIPLPIKSELLTNLPIPSKSELLTDLPLTSKGGLLTNPPVPLKSSILKLAPGDAASTPKTPLTEPPTTAAPKTKAEKQREYRKRIAASRTPEQVEAARKLDAERQRNCRLRKAANSDLGNGPSELTTASSSWLEGRSKDIHALQHLTHHQLQTSPQLAHVTQPDTSYDREKRAQSTWNTKWASSIMRFKLTFLDNDFGYACSVCDRLWFKNDLKPITAEQLEVISEWFIKENRQLCREEYETVCNTCKRTLNKKSLPPLAKANGFSYPDQPQDLPPLDPISERLISPRLPFTQVRRLRHDVSYGIMGQVINVPVDVQDMVKCLPRQLHEDDVINVNIERNVAHKSGFLREYNDKSTISTWLTVLQKSPLYRLYEIKVDLSRLDDDEQDDPSNRIESISDENTPESEILASRQHTMMWDKEDCLNIAPARQGTPLNTVYDRHAEELSFPSIYFGVSRRFNMGISLTPYMIASSEIRRRDRRGATPQKILYVAMKILRLRMADGINTKFRNVSVTENVTRRMLEDTELEEYVIQNLTCMKTVPNSLQYWASRKRDLFALIRQLGKPTVLLTINANETRWMNLLSILLKLSKKYPGKTAEDLNTSERCTLVNDDPVTCCIYFYKLINALMKMLKSKQSYNPFGKFFVKDYFLRIEFQHQGSPYAHILLWLNEDPRETVSENMPKTIDLVERLSSVSRNDVPNNSIYANQIHKHTFTCTKQGETTCRLGIPYWPMPRTRVLVPIPQSDERRQTLQQKAKDLRTSLCERRYASMVEFFDANGLTYVSYLDVVRSTLRRPTVVFRRNFDELMTNTFNPYLAGEVNSNIDIQFILDEYSCAEYVVEYVNKSVRGMGNLRRELIAMMQEHPDQDYTGQLKALSNKLLNAVEMSAQEAAWYLLRQPMSETSRPVVYIPTVWPTERQRCRKRRQQMDREGLDGDSTDIWTKNIIQRYEERPASLEQVYLAEFASWYANANDFIDEEDDVHGDDDEDSETVPEARTSRAPKEYRRRQFGRVIRYRRYDVDDTDNYKREMVLLYVQFRNEMSDIIDQNKFLQLFDENKATIMERRNLYETNLSIGKAMKELEAKKTLQDDDNNLKEEESRGAFVQRKSGEDSENVDDDCGETEQCDDKTEVLRACKIYQPKITGDHS